MCSRAKGTPSAAPGVTRQLSTGHYTLFAHLLWKEEMSFSATQDASGYSSAACLITIIHHLLPTHNLELLARTAEN